ncbi:hypothetical protein KK141_13850 [Dyella sp. LX-66]|uniref:hypothetical protein n=1 Tax=unclassified Dyella TaxID=2634549 RepID=UPI001BE0608D|nr:MULTISPECIES: hypothetical protein [unclassified Dyella]MBT2116433.1 hypothetical protein [Dyella sp. LX-1]MBT2140624.1 hypothetical protein [Dyella sp. LX-66]
MQDKLDKEDKMGHHAYAAMYPVAGRRGDMSIHGHVAIMEIPADGDVRFGSRPLTSFIRSPGVASAGIAKLGYKGVLRVFRPDSDADWLTRTEIAELESLARKLLEATRRMGAFDQLAPARTLPRLRQDKSPQAVRYFELFADHAVQEVRATELAERASRMLKRADQAGSSSGVLFEIEQYDPGATLDSLFEGFSRSFRAAIATEVDIGPVVIAAPARTPAQASAALRDELLGLGWPTSAEVGESHGSKAGNKGQWAKDRRDRGELFGVWSANERTFRHPAFQFDETGAIRPLVKELMLALSQNPDFTPETDKGGWRRAFWLHGPTLALAGANGAARAPADVFATEPAAVIEAARAMTEADTHDAW